MWSPQERVRGSRAEGDISTLFPFRGFATYHRLSVLRWVGLKMIPSEVGKLWPQPNPVWCLFFVNKMLFIKSRLLVYILPMAAFRQGQSWIVATETARPEKPKISASKPLTENICQNLSEIVQFLLKFVRWAVVIKIFISHLDSLVISWQSSSKKGEIKDQLRILILRKF